jgi:ribosomal protein L25 (general stress protein Ctc)
VRAIRNKKPKLDAVVFADGNTSINTRLADHPLRDVMRCEDVVQLCYNLALAECPVPQSAMNKRRIQRY